MKDKNISRENRRLITFYVNEQQILPGITFKKQPITGSVALQTAVWLEKFFKVEL